MREIEPKTYERFHFWMTLLWVVLMVPSILWWKNSVPWLIAISVWANIAGHGGAWQSSRAERRVKEVSEDNSLSL